MTDYVVSAGHTSTGIPLNDNDTMEVLAGGIASATTVNDGGGETVFAGGTASATAIGDGGEETVFAGGSDVGASIAGDQFVFGSASGDVVFGGGLQTVEAGGVASGTIVSNGGILSLLGTASGSTVSSGGTLELSSGAALAGTTAIGPGGTELVGTGYTLSGATVSGGVTLEVADSGTARNTTVLAGGTLELLGGGALAGTTTLDFGGTLAIGSGFTEIISNGQTSIGIVVLDGGSMIISSGGAAIATVVDAGGQQVVSAGGEALSTTLSGGVEVVSAGGTAMQARVDGGGLELEGGTANNTIIGDGVFADETIFSGVDTDDTVNSGANQFISGGKAVSALVDGGFQTVSGGTAVGTIVESGGSQDVNGGHQAASLAIGTTVESRGLMEVVEGTASNTLIDSGGTLALQGSSTTLTGFTTINSGGEEQVGFDYTVNGFTVANGVTLLVDGGTANNTTVDSGGTLELFGGVATGLTVDAGGTLIIADQTLGGFIVRSGVTLEVKDFGSASNTTVLSGGTLEIASGFTLAGITTIDTGGTLEIGSGYIEIISGGQTSSGIVVGSSGTQLVSSGGTASNTVVSNGGTLELLGGAAAPGFTIGSGGTLEIASGYTLLSYSPAAGATVTVASGGTASATQFPGLEYVLSGGSDVGAQLAAGEQIVSAGGVASNVHLRGDFDLIGPGPSYGMQLVYGVASATSLDQGEQFVESGGVASGANDDGQQVISAGGSAVGAVVSWSQVISSGGVAIDTMLSAGAIVLEGNLGPPAGQFVLTGGTASGTTVASSGAQFLAGLAVGTTVDGGGSEVVSVGGIASGTVLAGGLMVLAGTQTGLVWNSGTVEIVGGAVAPASPIAGGDTLIAASGGVASGVTVTGGGSLTIGTSGTGSAVVVSGGGFETVSRGGSDFGATIAAGGSQTVASGGTAIGTLVASGGSAFVAGGGTASNTVIGGGTLEIGSGGDATGAITFAPGTSGTLRIDGTTMPTATISGFTSGDTIDLTSLPFAAGDSAILGAENVLQVAEGNQVYDLHLDPNQNFSSDAFELASDGHDGTEITERADAFHIDINYDLSVQALQAANVTVYDEFTSGVADAVQYLESLFTNPVTLTLDVGYGEFDNQALGVNAIGENVAATLGAFSASAIAAELQSEGAPGAQFVPTGTTDLQMYPGEAIALGLAPSDGSLDGYVGFSSSTDFDYSDSAPQPGQYDFIATAEHEITEEMGRTSLLSEPNEASLMDQFRYTATGALDTMYNSSTKGSVAYFSLDGGATELAAWNNYFVSGASNNVDLGDWSTGPAPNGDDAFNAQSSAGVINIVSPTDIELMEALGWTTTTLPPAMIIAMSALPATGDVETGSIVTITLTMSESVTVIGTPTLTLNDGGTASYTAAASTGTALAFSYTVEPGQSTSALAVTAVNLPNDATVTNPNGGAADLALPSSTTFPELQIAITTPATSDFTGDGMSDVLWQNDNAEDSGSGQTAIWLMDGVNPTAEDIITTVPTSWHVVATGDFYGTGDAAILWQNDDGQAGLWEMNGTNPTAETVFASPPPSWHMIATGDFNGDGYSDVLWQYEDTSNSSDSQNGNVAIWEMNGASAIAAAVVAQPGPDWDVIGTGDFNGDGMSDILWQYEDASNPSDPQNGSVAIWEMNGLTPTVTAVVAQPGPDWHVVGTGDFNGDGKADILWQYEDSQNASDPQNGNVAIWLMNGTTPTAEAVVAQPGSAWQAIGTGDYDGSGRSDILWQNTNGQGAIWLMNGLTPTTESVFAAPPASWHLIPA